MNRVIHTSVRIVTLVDPITGDPYGHASLRPGRTYRNVDRGPEKLERVERYNVRRTKPGRTREFVRGPK